MATGTLERVAAGPQGGQRALDLDDASRVWTPEDEFAAGEELVAAMRKHADAKEQAKLAKAEEDAAVDTWRAVQRGVKLSRERGQW